MSQFSGNYDVEQERREALEFEAMTPGQVHSHNGAIYDRDNPLGCGCSSYYLMMGGDHGCYGEPDCDCPGNHLPSCEYAVVYGPELPTEFERWRAAHEPVCKGADCAECIIF